LTNPVEFVFFHSIRPKFQILREKILKHFDEIQDKKIGRQFTELINWIDNV
jgi:hypothetical protein